MFGFGIPELLFIALIVIVLFGSSRLPQLGRGLGEGITNFKRGLSGGDEAPPLSETSEEDKGA